MTSVGAVVDGREPLCSEDGTKFMQPLGKALWRSLKDLKMELLYDLVILILGVYLKEMKSLPPGDTFTLW